MLNGRGGFGRPAERYHAARRMGPADRIEVVVGDAGGVAALQAESGEVRRVGRLVPHDASELTGGRDVYPVIGRGKLNVELDLSGAVVHGVLVGLVSKAKPWRGRFDNARRGRPLGKSCNGLTIAHPVHGALCARVPNLWTPVRSAYRGERAFRSR